MVALTDALPVRARDKNVEAIIRRVIFFCERHSAGDVETRACSRLMFPVPSAVPDSLIPKEKMDNQS